MPRERGYWIGETNVGLAREALQSLVRWRAQRDGVVACGVSIDLEPDYAYSERLRTTQKTDPAAWLASVLRAGVRETPSRERDADQRFRAATDAT